MSTTAAVHAGANETDDGIALPNGLVVVQEGFRVRELELHQSLAASGMPLPQQRLAADEAAGFVPFDREAEAGFERGVFVGNVVAPVPVGLFDAQRIQRVIAGMNQAAGGAR